MSTDVHSSVARRTYKRRVVAAIGSCRRQSRRLSTFGKHRPGDSSLPLTRILIDASLTEPEFPYKLEESAEDGELSDLGEGFAPEEYTDPLAGVDILQFWNNPSRA